MTLWTARPVIAWAIAMAIATVYAQDAFSATPDPGRPMLRGGVVKLEASGKSNELNTGGLIVIEVADVGRSPVDNLQVSHSKSFLPLGQLRGVSQSEEKALAPPTPEEFIRTLAGRAQPPEPGYTWVLLSPTSECSEEIIVRFSVEEETVKLVYRVKVVGE